MIDDVVRQIKSLHLIHHPFPLLFAGLANSGSVASSNKPSVPSSALSHQALIGQLVSAQSHQLNHQAQNGKILPEPGWIPLTDTPVGKSPNPAITFLQGAVTLHGSCDSARGCDPAWIVILQGAVTLHGL